MPTYQFVEWRDQFGTAYSTSQILINLTQDLTLTAYYEIVSYVLTIVGVSQGTTSPVSGFYTIVSGSSQAVVAIPNSGYVFDHWTLDGVNAGSANPFVVKMDSNHTLTPVFTRQTVTITVVSGANGAVSPSGSQIMVVGYTYQFAAIPDVGYYLDHWELAGANIGSSNPIPLTAKSEDNGKTLEAIFTEVQPDQVTFTVAITPSGAGAVTPAVGTVTANVGDTVQFTATSMTNYTFDHWELNGTPFGNTNPLSLPITYNLDGATFTAVFVGGGGGGMDWLPWLILIGVVAATTL